MLQRCPIADMLSCRAAENLFTNAVSKKPAKPASTADIVASRSTRKAIVPSSVDDDEVKLRADESLDESDENPGWQMPPNSKDQPSSNCPKCHRRSMYQCRGAFSSLTRHTLLAKTTPSHQSHDLVSLLGQSGLVYIHQPWRSTSLVCIRQCLHVHPSHLQGQENHLPTVQSIDLPCSPTVPTIRPLLITLLSYRETGQGQQLQIPLQHRGSHHQPLAVHPILDPSHSS